MVGYTANYKNRVLSVENNIFNSEYSKDAVYMMVQQPTLSSYAEGILQLIVLSTVKFPIVWYILFSHGIPLEQPTGHLYFLDTHTSLTERIAEDGSHFWRWFTWNFKRPVDLQYTKTILDYSLLYISIQGTAPL